MWNEVRILQSETASVKKYIFEKSNAVAEAVLYAYPSYEKRTVICCSTQSGCPVGCRFCGAGDSFVRSLNAFEIVSQPLRLLADTGVNPNAIERLQIMFMSMGEPMLNLGALIPAMERLHELYPKAALLVSTSGPRVDYTSFVEASKWIPTIGLQFSVHESTDEARDRLIPFKAKLRLHEIVEEGEQWALATGRRPFFNYCAHEGNSSEADADRLSALFDRNIWEATISVVCERDEHVAAANERQRDLASSFMQKLAERGFSTRMFDPAGQDDIGGGCGQLHFVQKWFRDNPKMTRKSVGFGLPIVHTPHPLTKTP
jgi:23S rRNA (adenine2503-C2)-methyltransferase